MTNHIGPKIGLIDIETAPNLAYVWGLWDQNIGLNQIANEWRILSFCFKPLGKGKKVEYMDNSAMEDPLDDSLILERLWEILHEYDILIAQNGKRFDLKKINARLILEGYLPYAPVKIADTLLMARQVAAFTSNKLEWLSTYLSSEKKDSHREFPGFELWAEVMKHNPRAWAAMRKYNIPDVTSMEQVYMRLRPWVRGQANVAVYSDEHKPQCPVCGNLHLTQDGYSYTNVGQYLRYVCEGRKGCGAWSRSRYTLNSLAKRKALLSA